MSAIHISLAAEEIFKIGPITITNSLLAAFVGSGIILALFIVAARQVALRPTNTFSLAIETITDALLGLIQNVTNDAKKAQAFFPLLMTLFMFILINNWLGLLPGVGSITIATHEGVVPLFRGANADLNTTIGLAIISVVMTQVYAIKQLGVITHLKKYISLNPVLLFVGILEFVSEFSKMISFSFRLFGNIFAGEVLLLVIAYLAPALAPLPFFALELFVGLVQALVFTMLTLVFLEIATSDHSGHSDHEETPEHTQLTHVPAAGSPSARS